MGFPRGLKAQQDGDLKLAEEHYRRARDQMVREPVLYQNFGALLREQDREASAEIIYKEGARLFPKHPGILANWANLLKSQSPAASISLGLSALRLQISQDFPAIKIRGVLLPIISRLRELKLYQWSMALAKEGLGLLGTDSQLLLLILLLSEDIHRESESSIENSFDLKDLVELIELQMQKCSPVEQAEIRLGLASYCISKADLDDALVNYELAMKVLNESCIVEGDEKANCQKLVDVNSWNFGCALLKHQELRRGWQLYEYGLRTPAAGQQKWQRALKKPFSAVDLPLWRGESLSGHKLLLLEEQAVGDAMMFITLVPTLLEESSSIGLLLGDRLVPIYLRALQDYGLGNRVHVWSYRDVKSGRLSAEKYTLQSPLGSICQHRFVKFSDYGRHLPLLKAKLSRTQELRNEYLHQGSPVNRIVGISWRGGGKGIRIKQKSMDEMQFSQLLQPIPGVRFVSLQYGNYASTVEDWRSQGLDVIHDPRINPLKNMDLWLAQVAACDSVISVANTTIHGAGGLGLPTLCLLSTHCDWRWFSDPEITRSYWYPSVGIAREHSQDGWDNAIIQGRAWLEQGCLMPVGPTSTRTVQ